MKYSELKETINLMNSNDYKDRFRAEFYQLEIRCEKFRNMLDDYEEEILSYVPSCSYDFLHTQYVYMCDYLECLKQRAEIEKIVL